MKIQYLLVVSPFCASVALAAPDVRPLPSALEHKTLPTALKRSVVTQPSTRPNGVGSVLPAERMTDISVAIPHEESISRAPTMDEPVSATPTLKKPSRRSNTAHPRASSSMSNAQTSSDEARTNEAIKLYEAGDYQAPSPYSNSFNLFTSAPTMRA